MNVNPGELNKRVSIIRKTKDKDAAGYYTETEDVVHTCWAKFSRISGTEIVKADAGFGQVKARFLIRHTRMPIDRKMVVRYDGEDYGIEYVNDYEDSHEYTEIWASRGSTEAKI